jgi:putative transposase
MWVQVPEGHLMPDHVHMLISISPRYSVAEVIGYLKGKTSISIAQNGERKLRNFLGRKFWARGYFVSTVRRNEEMIRAYIRNQEISRQGVGSAAIEARVLMKSHLSSQIPL